MAKNIPFEKDFTYAKEPRPGDTWDRSDMAQDIRFQDGYLSLGKEWAGPRSMKTALQWMADHGLR